MRSKDRLDELRRLAPPGDAPPAQSPAPASDLEDLFREVEQVRSWIHDVTHNTQLIRRLHADPTFHANPQLQEQLDSLVTQCNAAGLKVCGALRQLEVRARGEPRGAAGRIARLQYAATRRLYADALQTHERALQQLRDNQFRLLREQIKLTNLTISDEECEQLLESSNIALFVDNVRAETSEARRALRDAETRREELARAEAALHDVHALFLQLAHLVAQQQEQVDSVEYYALQATEHVDCGGRELLKGTVSRRKTRNKKLGLVVCLASGFLIVLLVLVLS